VTKLDKREREFIRNAYVSRLWPRSILYVMKAAQRSGDLPKNRRYQYKDVRAVTDKLRSDPTVAKDRQARLDRLRDVYGVREQGLPTQRARLYGYLIRYSTDPTLNEVYRNRLHREGSG